MVLRVHGDIGWNLVCLSLVIASPVVRAHVLGARTTQLALGWTSAPNIRTDPQLGHSAGSLRSYNTPEYHNEKLPHPDEEGREEGEKGPSRLVSLALAYCLMGGIGSLMIVFYLVNSSLLGVKKTTWRVLNMTTSIFVAVLLYGSLKSFLVGLFEPGFHALVVMTLVVFVAFFVGARILLFNLKGGGKHSILSDGLQLEAASTILGHICGFAAMYGVADAREIETVEELDAVGIVVLILLTAITIGVMSLVMDHVCKQIAERDDAISNQENQEDDEKWIDTCEEMDDDVFCLAISFLVVLLLQYMILGKVQPYEPGKLDNVTQSNANSLLMWAIFFKLLVWSGAVAMVKYHELVASPLLERASTVVQHMNSMISCWCTLFWAEWQLYVSGWEGTIMGGCLIVAVLLTFFSFAMVLGINLLRDMSTDKKMLRRMMNSLELSFGLLVGFTWERAFDVAFEEIEMHLEHKEHTTSAHWLGILLLLIVAPAWRMYILPKAHHMELMTKPSISSSPYHTPVQPQQSF